MHHFFVLFIPPYLGMSLHRAQRLQSSFWHPSHQQVLGRPPSEVVLSLPLTVLGKAEVRRSRPAASPVRWLLPPTGPVSRPTSPFAGRRGRDYWSPCPCALFTVEPVPEVTFLGPWLQAGGGLLGNTPALSSSLVPNGMFLMGVARRLAPVTLVAS